MDNLRWDGSQQLHGVPYAYAASAAHHYAPYMHTQVAQHHGQGQALSQAAQAQNGAMMARATIAATAAAQAVLAQNAHQAALQKAAAAQANAATAHKVAKHSGVSSCSTACTSGRQETADADDQVRFLGDRYIVMEKLGEGTYGKVYKALLRDTTDTFAIKKIRIAYEDEGVPSTAIREVALLKECDHPNVIKLHEVFTEPNALYLVFEHLDMDLRKYIKTHGSMHDPAKLKSGVYQCMRGVEFCHAHRILHRDLKPQNLLVDVKAFRIKLADFGLARSYSVPLQNYTHEVVTLWYRAPEILLGSAKYATPADIWSMGCIMAEMATGHALFPGDSEIDTLYKQFRVLGTPDDEAWAGVSDLKDYSQAFPAWKDTGLAQVKQQGPGLGDGGLEMIKACLRYSPVHRLGAGKLLRDPYFNGVEVGAPSG